MSKDIKKTNEPKVLNIGDVMPSVLWEIAEMIVKKQKHFYSQDPKTTDTVMWDMLPEDWFDYLEEKLTGIEN
jgi:hypothetical protein|tara:strand:+ start:199 stop:414 length:216 start_codon:yes stop_codon:yes gene_type:complete